MQLKLFEEYYTATNNKLLKDLFYAYYDARRNKRNTINQLKFELNFESSLINLYESIVERSYKPERSICFMVQKPVKREIFAADFHDRVVHHLIYNYISPIFEKTFINDSYSCRKGKGTHYGIKRIDHFIRSCSQNYSHDCYILKLDIRGYFMSMNRNLLFEMVKQELLKKRKGIEFDLDLVLYLIEKTIFNDPTKNCIIKGKKDDWQGLPKTKSLFHAKENCGLPIGNLTSQLFGNVYLNDFDHFVKRDLGIRYYGRYVDDFVLVHSSKHYLQSCIEHIRTYLKENLYLDLHPDKVYLQHYSKGVQYLGAIVKPHRIYVANRTKGNFFEAIGNQNRIARDHKPTKEDQQAFQSSMNSYLGIMKHYKTYKLRKEMIRNDVSGFWENIFYAKNYEKFTPKKKVLKNSELNSLMYD